MRRDAQPAERRDAAAARAHRVDRQASRWAEVIKRLFLFEVVRGTSKLPKLADKAIDAPRSLARSPLHSSRPPYLQRAGRKSPARRRASRHG
jgi:hypothetical protein